MKMVSEYLWFRAILKREDFFFNTRGKGKWWWCKIGFGHVNIGCLNVVTASLTRLTLRYFDMGSL